MSNKIESIQQIKLCVQCYKELSYIDNLDILCCTNKTCKRVGLLTAAYRIREKVGSLIKIDL